MAECKLEEIMLDAFLTSGLQSSMSCRRPKTPNSELAVQQYIRDCNKFGAIPADAFRRHVDDDTFVMRFYGLGPLGAKAISRPLESNTYIRTLDLEGNCIRKDGALYLASSLRDNVYITKVNVADNNLGRNGVAAMIEMMRENTTITSLNLSGNELSDRDGRIFYYLLKHNHILKELYIAHNNLAENSAEWLVEAFEINDTLQYLDISWNHFRRAAAVDIARMIADNCCLREVHMSMNGLGPEGAREMSKAIRENSTLEVLDISANRISNEGAKNIASALEANETLKVLKMGKNPINPTGAMGILRSVAENESSAIQILDLEGIDVTTDFELLEAKLKKKRKMKIVRGWVIAKKARPRVRAPPPKFEDREAQYQKDPLTKLRQYCNKKNLRLLDLFKQFDKDMSWSVSIEELLTGIKAKGIDLTDEEAQELVKKLDRDGDGDIDYKEICAGDALNKIDRIKAAKWNREQKRLIEEHYKQQEEEDLMMDF